MENTMHQETETMERVDETTAYSETEQADRAAFERMKAKRRKSLDRYLEGWTVREVLTPNGNVRRESIYIGDYYATDETKTQRILRKAVYILLFAAAIAGFVLSAIQPTGANVTGYTGLAQGLALLAMIWQLNSLFIYVTAPREMTVADYKGGPQAICRSSLCLAIAAAVPALATTVHLCTDPAQWKTELLCVLGYLAAGALMLLLYFAEKKLTYSSRPSPERRLQREM